MADALQGLPVAGYRPQSSEAVEAVNGFKQVEERLLRQLDAMATAEERERIDPRWLSVARTHFEQGFMALNRSIFQPSRIALPQDEAKD